MNTSLKYKKGDIVVVTEYVLFGGALRGKRARVTQCEGDPENPFPDCIKVIFHEDDLFECFLDPIVVQLVPEAVGPQKVKCKQD